MKDFIIRVAHPYEESYNAPEYANNHLMVELDFRKMIPGTRELSVRVYSSEQVFMGADSILFPSAKQVRRYKFDVCSPDEWVSDSYYIFIYRNGYLRWTTQVYLPDYSFDSHQSSLEATSCKSEEEFFANREDNVTDSLITSWLEEQCTTMREEEAKQEQAQAANHPAKVSAKQRLQELIGLGRVKREIEDASTMALFLQRRKDLNLCMQNESRHHMLFLGNPGTGKTTVAKLIGEMYHEMGLLSLGHTIETNRAKLVGEFIGQTEQKTMSILESARGGVLFIDEAYTLISSESDSKDFGKEVLNALLPILAEPNPDMIIIFAGYEDKMERLLKFNQGLKDRFPLKFHFEDYTADELLEIARKYLESQNFTLSRSAEARLQLLIGKATSHRDKYFGNARWVHNLIEQGILKSMAKRVMSLPQENQDAQAFSLIEECDIIDAEKALPKGPDLDMRPRRIGFTA